MINNIILKTSSIKNFTYNKNHYHKSYNLPHIVKTEEVIG